MRVGEIVVTAQVARFVHQAFLYGDVEEFLAGTVAFVRAGVEAGEPVLVAVPRPRLELIRERLNGSGDAVRFVDMAEAGRNPGRIIPNVLHEFIDGHGAERARVIGEPIWATRSAAEYPACVQHEALINLAFAERAATILCPYDIHRLPPAALADAARTHPETVRAGEVRPSPAYVEPEAVVADLNRPLPEPPGTAVSLHYDGGRLAEVRRFVAAQAQLAGLPADRVDDVRIAANEVASNSVVHGGGAGTLSVWRESGCVVVALRDGGTITDHLAGRVPVGVDSEGGRGLLLVHQLCDLVQVHTVASATEVRLHIRL